MDCPDHNMDWLLDIEEQAQQTVIPWGGSKQDGEMEPPCNDEDDDYGEADGGDNPAVFMGTMETGTTLSSGRFIFDESDSLHDDD